MQSLRYQFDRFEVQPVRRLLLIEGRETPLTPRAFDLLVALVERAGQLISKNDLLELVWPSLVVEENNLQVHVSTLRRVPGSEAIGTVPGRGSRLTMLPNEAGLDGQSEPAPTPAPRAGNLPAQMPPLYGRAGDVASLTQLLERHQVVSVVGPGGIGKTRV